MNIAKEVAALERMTVGELHDRYADVFGEAVRSRHKAYLIRRIAWRLQANAEGGLSERALRRAEELANDADVRTTPPRDAAVAKAVRACGIRTAAVSTQTDSRLPSVGSQIVRDYKRQKIVVTVLHDGFEYQGERYKSLSAVAKTITGAHMNGYRFFQLEAKS